MFKKYRFLMKNTENMMGNSALYYLYQKCFPKK